MSGRSKKYEQATLWGTLSDTGSQALGAGPSPCNSPDGEIDPLTPPVAPVNRGRRRASKKARKTSDISGPSFTPSSASVALCASLASRCQALVDTDGSPEYTLTWSRKATVSGLSICRLRCSQRHTSATDFFGLPIEDVSGWGTPSSRDHKDAGPAFEADPSIVPVESRLPGQAALVEPLDGWGTPTAHDRTHSPRKVHHGEQLANQAELAGWPTTRQSDGDQGIRSEEGALAEYERKGTGADLPTVASLAGWPTATVGDSRTARNRTANRSDPESQHHDGLTLVDAVELAGWPTPTTEDAGRNGSLEGWRKFTEEQQRSGCRLRNQAHTILGPTPESSSARTARRGASRLNPSFSRWLMAFPVTVDHCSPGWNAWVTIQNWLSDYYASLDATEPQGSEPTETQS